MAATRQNRVIDRNNSDEREMSASPSRTPSNELVVNVGSQGHSLHRRQSETSRNIENSSLAELYSRRTQLHQDEDTLSRYSDVSSRCRSTASLSKISKRRSDSQAASLTDQNSPTEPSMVYVDETVNSLPSNPQRQSIPVESELNERDHSEHEDLVHNERYDSLSSSLSALSEDQVNYSDRLQRLDETEQQIDALRNSVLSRMLFTNSSSTFHTTSFDNVVNDAIVFLEAQLQKSQHNSRDERSLFSAYMEEYICTRQHLYDEEAETRQSNHADESEKLPEYEESEVEVSRLDTSLDENDVSSTQEQNPEEIELARELPSEELSPAKEVISNTASNSPDSIERESHLNTEEVHQASDKVQRTNSTAESTGKRKGRGTVNHLSEKPSKRIKRRRAYTSFPRPDLSEDETATEVERVRKSSTTNSVSKENGNQALNREKRNGSSSVTSFTKAYTPVGMPPPPASFFTGPTAPSGSTPE